MDQCFCEKKTLDKLPHLSKSQKKERIKQEKNWIRPRYQTDFPRHSYDNTVDFQTPLAYSFEALKYFDHAPKQYSYKRCKYVFKF